jgi:outer membrane protein assembly factor BamA
MGRRAQLRFGLLAVVFSLNFSLPCGAQEPQSPKSCPRPSVSKIDKPSRKVILESIRFDGPVHLPDNDVTQIIAATNEQDLNADDSHWTEQLAEIGLRSAWQDRGYFRMTVATEAHSLGGDAVVERFEVSARVNEGLQYHLANLQFTGGRAIPDGELRQVFPLHEGEFFSVGGVRTGLEALTKLYSSHGYIDFTATPETQVDDNLQRIVLVMHLDEQKQYRVGSVEIRGLDPSLEARLRSIIVPGEIFNPDVLLAFVRESKSVLPPRGIEEEW